MKIVSITNSSETNSYFHIKKSNMIKRKSWTSFSKAIDLLKMFSYFICGINYISCKNITFCVATRIKFFIFKF